MSAVLRWEEPAPARTGDAGPRPRPSKYEAMAAELRRHPDRWAVIFEGAGRSAYTITNALRRGRFSGFEPEGAFEAVSRVRGGGQAVVYARYVGGGR